MEVSSKETWGESHAGFGAKGRPQFWIGSGNNGAPGLRPHYHANYCGAFVLDPDGRNIEAVCHLPA